MNLTCTRCDGAFEADRFRGYCDTCVDVFRADRRRVNQCQHPTPDMYLDGTFAREPCPRTVIDPAGPRSVCGLCGGDQIEPGYGIGSGYGMGCYNFCLDCNTFLDFVEDRDE